MGTWMARYQVPGDALPLGVRQNVVVGANTYIATFVKRPVQYVIVAWPTTTKPTPEDEVDLEQVRSAICALGNLDQSPSIPKLAVVSPTDGLGAIYFRGRLADGSPWHHRVAATGLLGLGVALSQEGTTASLLGGRLITEIVVDTPAGPRIIGRDDEGHQTVITLPVTVLPGGSGRVD